MLTLTIDERNIKIHAESHDSFVRGTVGAKCKVVFTDFWSSYNKTIVFKRSSNSLGTPYTIFIDKLEDEITIPWEILTESGAFKVGAYGTTNTEILPTLWSDDIVIKYGSDTAGQAPEPPTPSVYQELIETAKQATEVAQSVRDDADSGKFDGKDGVDGKEGYTPIKGVDYFDGAKGDKGDKGDKGEPGADGKDYNLTDADKTEIAEMAKADIDNSLSLISENPVQNKIVTEACGIESFKNELYSYKGKGKQGTYATNTIVTIIYDARVYTYKPNKKIIIGLEIYNNNGEEKSLYIGAKINKSGTNSQTGSIVKRVGFPNESISKGSNYAYFEILNTAQVNYYPQIWFQNATGNLDITMSKVFLIEVDENDTYDWQSHFESEPCSEYVLCNRTQHRLDNLDSTVFAADKIVHCFGDSQTGGGHGNGIQSYPYFLRELLGEEYTVNNEGNGGENMNAIAFRMGTLPVWVEPFTLPAAATQVGITYKIANGKSKSNLFTSWNGSNPVLLNGTRCYIFSTSQIQRVTAGLVETVFDRPVRALPPNPISTLSGVFIIQAGANGGFNTLEEYIDLLKSMVEAIPTVSKKYIIICPWHSDFTNRFDGITYDELIGRLYDNFGEHLLDIRTYLVNYGLADNNLTATETDTAEIANNKVPASLRVDGVHMNNYGYSSQAKKVYQFGHDLGYW